MCGMPVTRLMQGEMAAQPSSCAATAAAIHPALATAPTCGLLFLSHSPQARHMPLCRCSAHLPACSPLPAPCICVSCRSPAPPTNTHHSLLLLPLCLQALHLPL